MEANVNVAAICAHRFLRNCSQFVILWQLRTLNRLVNKLSDTWYIMLLLCPFISKADSVAVESSPRNPWIESSNPGGNKTSISVSSRMNLFFSENWSFCTLKHNFCPKRLPETHQNKCVVISEQKSTEKGIRFFFTNRRGPRIGKQRFTFYKHRSAFRV